MKESFDAVSQELSMVNITEIDFVLLSIFTLFFLYLCESEVSVLPKWL